MLEYRTHTQLQDAIDAAHQERGKALIAMYRGAKDWIRSMFAAHEKGRLA